MASNNPIPNPRRIFIFDNPRTCSHLFSKLFANHSELQLLYHPFLPAALYGPERYQQKTKHCAAADEVQREWGTSEEFREWNVVTYESANRKLVEEIEAAERQNKSIFCSEHLNALMKHDRMLTHLRSPTRNSHPTTPSSASEPIPENPTYLPDPLLTTLTPILLIRHPALTIPSSWRTESRIKNLSIDDEDFYLLTTNRWSRELLTYLLHRCTASGWRKPLVIDAYDVVHRTGAVTGRLCGELGLDPAGVQERWRQLPREEWPGHSVVVAYTRDLLGSGGVERGVGKPLEEDFDIEVETEKWKGEFGNEVGMKLRKCVEAEMADYEYLRSFKMEV
ncbi:hypothetical protein KC343_g471 [Hortaea werneckii]|uniref:Sulfotransferase domain-containing protein n=1 Tax=Hortaea werneckii TaxID=91943 RepID=A0A3M7HPI3_HORWE|nr:hypothetical protein KC343_g471 [Hortaea werneckii]KAI7683942.1 hypothetical protein KC319_g201 [Hortaea werneckii]RMZ14915.1 hypothetical protein D0864_00003 [Hortaea werneckii]